MANTYVPPFPHIKKRFAVSTVKGELWASIRYDELEGLISQLLQGVEVDEEWYCKTYPDVAQAIASGVIESAQVHFVFNGYFEGRLPFEMKVDDAWYAQTYPDIGEAIRAGTIPSATEHFQEFGYGEGRLPSKIA